MTLAPPSHLKLKFCVNCDNYGHCHQITWFIHEWRPQNEVISFNFPSSASWNVFECFIFFFFFYTFHAGLNLLLDNLSLYSPIQVAFLLESTTTKTKMAPSRQGASLVTAGPQHTETGEEQAARVFINLSDFILFNVFYSVSSQIGSSLLSLLCPVFVHTLLKVTIFLSGTGMRVISRL